MTFHPIHRPDARPFQDPPEPLAGTDAGTHRAAAVRHRQRAAFRARWGTAAGVPLRAFGLEEPARGEPVETHVLWLRLAGARADCARAEAAGDAEGLREARFVVTTLMMRIAHRLHAGAPAARPAAGSDGAAGPAA